MEFSIRNLLGGRKTDTRPKDLFGDENGIDPLFHEQFKALRAKFEYKVDILKLKTVAVTSAIAGEGKTTSCINLAMHLAVTGRKKVLLIDLDLRKSDLARNMKISPLPGLSEYLKNTVPLKDIVRIPTAAGLYVIPSGLRDDAPGELITGDKFRVFLREIRNQFDIILLDTPPVVPVADTLGLRDQVDGFLFVYRLGFTPHHLMAQAVEEIGEKGIVGVVLNGAEPQRQKYYERYYGKYYRREEKEGKEGAAV